MKTKWILPLPEEGPIWDSIPRISKVIPFGYILDPDREGWLLPVQKELDLLEEVKGFRRQYSLRRLAEWLSAESGREISHMGLSQRLKIEKKRKALVVIKKQTAAKYKKELAQIEEIEHRRIGARAKSKDVQEHEKKVFDITFA